jgi:sarcosine oxidase, subunit beta
MKRYSVFAVVRQAFAHHQGWEKAWRSPQPKPRYDVVIVGAGGHGLATAYYLGKNHGITNVAVIEKGWLGGGICRTPRPRSTKRPAACTRR